MIGLIGFLLWTVPLSAASVDAQSVGVVPAPAGAAPNALELLDRVFKAKPTAYEADIVVERPAAARVRVLFAPPNRYRREVGTPDGTLLFLAVSDGETAWAYDARRKLARRSLAPGVLPAMGGLGGELAERAEYFDAALSSDAPVAGRKVWRLDLSWKGTGIRRRLWVDRKNGFVVGGELLAADGEKISSFRVRRLRRPRRWGAETFLFKPPPEASVREDWLNKELAERIRGDSGLTARLPAIWPAGFVFDGVEVVSHGRRKILHYRFSDGIEAASLFQAPPRSRISFGEKMKPRRRLRVGASSGVLTDTAEGGVLSWSAGGSRFVLIAPVSSETLRKVAESLP